MKNKFLNRVKYLHSFQRNSFKILATVIAFAIGQACANSLLILQIGASADDDNNISHSFVELYNAGSNDVNLNGYSLQYAAGTKVAENAVEDSVYKKIDLSGTIKAGRSFLILGKKRSTNANPALKIDDNYGDINDPQFILSNRAVKVVLMSNTTLLTAQNPFNINGGGAKANGYVDMIGVINDSTDKIFGYEGTTNYIANVYRISKQVGLRRKSLIDTDNNSNDFEIVTYSGVTAEVKEIKRPKNHGYGEWNPIPEPEEEPEPQESSKLMILQANTFGNNNGGAAGFARSLVELYNNTDAAINLTSGNYYLHVGNATAWTDVIKLEGTIPAKSSFLIVDNTMPAVTGSSGNFNATPTAPLPAADIDAPFVLSNSGFKIALMRNQSAVLSVDNPFTETSLSANYVDMLGVISGTNGFETAVAQQSRPQCPRRVSLADTDNNSKDFAQVDYRNSNVPASELYKYWPRNSSNGQWNPITGEPREPNGQDGTDGSAQEITSFKFSYASMGWEGDNYLQGNIDHINKTITFTTQKWIENIDKLIAVFVLNDKGVAKVGGTSQVSGITKNDFRKDVVYTVGDASYTVKFVSPQASGLPVIRIDTKDYAPILNKVDYVNMTFALTDPNNPTNNIVIENTTDGIRGRGNTTWGFPKKPYRIKFDKKQSLFGLPEAKSWVLLAEYLDPTLIKNTVAFELGGRFNLHYNHTYRHVELYLNGVYRGTYGLTEQNQVGYGRVDIDEKEGWLVEFDFHYDEEPKFRTTNYNLPVMIKSPETEPVNISNNAYDFVRKDINELCDSMASINFPENGYRNLINMEQLISYFMVPIIIGYGDLEAPGSVYAYKDKNEKISMGPLWDYDMTFGYGLGNTPGYTLNASYNTKCSPTEKPITSNSFFNRFFQDPVFLVKWKEFWNDKYSEISSILQFIDETANKINKSAEENFKIWWIDYPVDFNEQIGIMKNYYETRITYLNVEYNKVAVLPKNKTFAAQTFGYSAEISPQKFTLVSYGDMQDLSATLKNANLSDFEISTQLNQTTSTGNGGYLATLSVKPKNSLVLAATYTDTLILSGTNQDKSFEVKVPLTFVVNKINYNMSDITFENKTITYDGKAHSIEISGTLPSGVSVSYTGNEKIAVGVHTVTAKFATTNSNYKVPASMTAKLTIQTAVPISDYKSSPNNNYGIALDSSIVSQSAKITVKTPEPAQINLIIYDNLGNIMFEISSRTGSFVWDLTNKTGKNVANGSYLVIAEAKSRNGKIYRYFAKIGVKRE